MEVSVFELVQILNNIVSHRKYTEKLNQKGLPHLLAVLVKTCKSLTINNFFTAVE